MQTDDQIRIEGNHGALDLSHVLYLFPIRAGPECGRDLRESGLRRHFEARGYLNMMTLASECSAERKSAVVVPDQQNLHSPTAAASFVNGPSRAPAIFS